MLFSINKKICNVFLSPDLGRSTSSLSVGRTSLEGRFFKPRNMTSTELLPKHNWDQEFKTQKNTKHVFVWMLH